MKEAETIMSASVWRAGLNNTFNNVAAQKGNLTFEFVLFSPQHKLPN